MKFNIPPHQHSQRNAPSRGRIAPSTLRWMLIILTALFIVYGLPLINDYRHPPIHQIVLVDVSGSMFGKKKAMRDGTPRDVVYISLARSEQVLRELSPRDRWNLYFYVNRHADPALSDVKPEHLARELKDAYENVHLRYLKNPKSFEGTDQAIPLEEAEKLVSIGNGQERFQVLICCDGEQDWNNALVKARVQKAVASLAKQQALIRIELCGIEYPNRTTMMNWTQPLGDKIVFGSLMEK